MESKTDSHGLIVRTPPNIFAIISSDFSALMQQCLVKVIKAGRSDKMISSMLGGNKIAQCRKCSKAKKDEDKQADNGRMYSSRLAKKTLNKRTLNNRYD